VQYKRLDPIGMIVGIGADISELTADAADEESEQLAVAGVMALAQNLASKTYAQGIVEFIAAIDPNNPTSNPGALHGTPDRLVRSIFEHLAANLTNH
jgi:hypothetical protein